MLILPFLLLLASCEPTTERVVEKEWSPEQPKLVAWYLGEGEERHKVKEEEYYEDGTMEYSGEYDPEGKRHGEWRYYHKNGNLWSLGHFDHGLKTGVKELYWQDGSIRYKGQFLDDQKTGTWTFYNMDGSVLEELTFEESEKAEVEMKK